MDEKNISNSIVVLSDDKMDTLYPMFIGVSCALFMWRIQREDSKNGKSSLLQKLDDAHELIDELKKRRSEEAKANEKVVSIFAAREQSWFNERKNLRQHIRELNDKLKQNEATLQERDKCIEEVENKRKEIEEKVKKAENLADKLRENVKGEALKHKTAFIELVSNQRQLEAEMCRALRQVEAARQEVDSVLDQKEELVLMNQRLSMELVRLRKDSEQKDQILSAMLRKSKLDTVEKQMLLKEVKSSKAKKKQAEVESRKWDSVRNMLSSKRLILKSDVHSKGVDPYSLLPGPYSTDEPQSIDDVDRSENWVNLEQRHEVEIDAFAEQLRLKDEKLEAFRWRLLSMEIESKRMQSHIEALDHEITQLRQENTKMEALLLDRDAELHSIKQQLVSQFNPPNLQKLNFNSPTNESSSINHDTVWSKVKVVKTKPGQKKQVTELTAEEISQVDEIPSNDIVLTLNYPNKETREAKSADHFRQESVDSDIASVATSASTDISQGSSKRNNSTMKMDIHALGVSYKIKRLKQQFLMLERLTGESSGKIDKNESGDFGFKDFYALISLMNKQADRYQSLQAKTDDICQRMHDDDLNLKCRGSAIARTEEETKRMEHFLEETFQLQRYIVATGQKMMEVQARIASGFVDHAEKIERPESFDMNRFADSIRTLFREVQRGLEVRISRIIGDLEGSLACDGIIHVKR